MEEFIAERVKRLGELSDKLAREGLTSKEQAEFNAKAMTIVVFLEVQARAKEAS